MSHRLHRLCESRREGKNLLRMGVLLTLLLFLTTGALAKDKEKKDPFAKVDKQKVDTAINKGLEFLLGQAKQNRPLAPSLLPPDLKNPGQALSGLSAEELVLYTLIKGGADTKEETFNKLLEKVLAKKLERTYLVSVLAMALAELDSQKYQAQIAECGQFLMDNQCNNGQWSYGEPVEPLNIKITPSLTGSSKDKESGTRGVRRIPLQPRKKAKGGPASGDNSNTQYACLGLRACMQADVIIPNDVFALTEQWFEKKQQKDGGWGYDSPYGNQINPAYGSMSVGALGSLIICKFYLTKRIPENDPKILQGLDWLIKNFTVTGNPKFSEPQRWYYYYLYAMERLGAFLETEEFGKHEWYPTGAELLLKQQEADGSWKPLGPKQQGVEDTCFAILFLRRATKSLRAKITGDK